LSGFAVTKRCARHRLDAARDEEVAVACDDCVAGADHGGEPGGTEPVDRDARDRVRQAGEQRGHPRDIAVVLPRLVGGAEPDLFDLALRHAGAIDDLADHERGEVVRAHTRQRAAVATDRGANACEDDCAGHGAN